jgi:hypothetical protein
MIPNLQVTNDEFSGIKHATCAEMNRRAKPILTEDEAHLLWAIEYGMLIRLHGTSDDHVSLKHYGLIEHIDRWHITDKGRAALPPWKNTEKQQGIGDEQV